MINILGIIINIFMLLFFIFILYIYFQSRKNYDYQYNNQSKFCLNIICPCDDPNSECLQYSFRKNKNGATLCNYNF